MINLGTDEIVKYPFLAEAGKYLSDKGFSLEQFGTDPDLKRIVSMAFDRIQVASDGKIYNSNSSTNDSSLPMEVFSFLIAVILLKLTGMHTLIRRFSLAEARRSERFLEKDLSNLINRCLSTPRESSSICLSLKLLILAFGLPKKVSGVTEKEITSDGSASLLEALTRFFKIS